MKKKEIITGSIVMLIIFTLFLSVGYYNSLKNSTKNEDIFVESTEPKETPQKSQSKEIRVEITGEVKNPGVYTLALGSRVEDLVIRAGGFTETADTVNMVSQAKKLKDEERISVRRKENLPDGSNQGAAPVAAKPDPNLTTDGKININTASREELMKIPGVGEVTAQKILDYREKNGAFNSMEDLKKLGRIGDKTLEKMKEKADVE